jgi:hypothetical protein
MKYVFLFVLTIISFSLFAQEYNGAESYWDRKKKAEGSQPRQQAQTQAPLSGSGSYLSKGGGLLIAGDLFMLGSAMTAIGSTISYEKNMDALYEENPENSEEEAKRLKDTYYTGLYISGGMVAVGFILRMAGHIQIKRAGDMFPINDKTAMNITGDGLTLCYRF